MFQTYYSRSRTHEREILDDTWNCLQQKNGETLNDYWGRANTVWMQLQSYGDNREETSMSKHIARGLLPVYDDVKNRVLFHPMLSRSTMEETLRLAEHEQRIKRRSGEGIEDRRHAPADAGVGQGGGVGRAAAAGTDGRPSHEPRGPFFCQVHGVNSSHSTPDCHKLRQDSLSNYNDFMAFMSERDSVRGPGFPQAGRQYSGRLSD